MYNFAKGLYTDVRIEHRYTTSFSFKQGELNNNVERETIGAFIRVFDGNMWYYASTDDVDNIQTEINKLSGMAKPNKDINSNPVVKLFEVNVDEINKFKNNKLIDVKLQTKQDMLKKYIPLFSSNELVKFCMLLYLDNYVVTSFYSSKGSKIKYDYQVCTAGFGASLSDGGEPYSTSMSLSDDDFHRLFSRMNVEDELKKAVEFMKNAKPIEKGKYRVLMSPNVTGVFAHESFGHKSEADFMVGDEALANEWVIGKKVGSDCLSIVDSGLYDVGGYIPYDNEGTKAKKTYLIKSGVLTGRLHSAVTAAAMGESLTSNARAINFEYEPIVRMTTTFVEPGNKSLKEVLSTIDKGIYVETFQHGSGSTIFTIAPNRCYLIENGKITSPVKVSVLTGNVFETLSKIEAVTNDFDLGNVGFGGCGKMEQMGLPVGMGGCYILVNELEVY